MGWRGEEAKRTDQCFEKRNLLVLLFPLLFKNLAVLQGGKSRLGGRAPAPLRHKTSKIA